ncbi:MAG: hypothetical protein K2X38_09485 [Gemmataceae bacterium]|nr:hypothetical protein [Gemmataceae bacterium]
MVEGVVWPDRTLTQLEGQDWGPPTFDSYVVTNSHALRYKPLREFTAEDLRFMLSQQNSLPVLMPMALEVLEVDPFAGGDMYEGALLSMAVRVAPAFWREHPRLWYRLDAVLLVARQLHETLEREVFSAAAVFEAARPNR